MSAVVLALVAFGTPRASAGNVGAVFYSGKGCAGLTQAGAALRRLREQKGPCIPGFNGGTGFYDGRWASNTHCDPSHATFPEKIDGTTITQLVGFSLGRLGPLYFLKTADSERESKINYIVMLDPGSSEVTSNGCDTSGSLNATGLLRTWLGRSSRDRLFVMAGNDTQSGGHSGINSVYLRSLPSSTVTAQVFVCDVNMSHDEVMSRFASMIGKSAPASCPGGSRRGDLPATGGGGTGGGVAQPPGGGGGGPPGGGGSSGSGSVSLAQGPAASAGYRYAISLSGFAANSGVSITCYDSVSTGGFYTFSLTTDGSGNASTASYCYSGEGPDHWVVAGGVESNHVAWGGGSSAPLPPSPTRSIQIGWSGAHAGWIWMTLNGFATGSHQYTCAFASGGDATFTLGETESPEYWDNGHTCYDFEHGDTVWVEVEGVSSNSITVP